MFRLFLCLAFTGFCLAFDESDNYDVPESFKASVRINDVQLFHTIRLQSTQVAELTLRDQTEQGCFLRTVCSVATLEDGRAPRLSMARGIRDFKKLLDKMVEEAKDTEEDFPNIHRTMASFSVGSATRSLSMCEQLFPCETARAHSLLSNALTSTPDATVVTTDNGPHQRTSCQAAGNLCPTVSIACALCGVFLPGQCGDQCIIAGLYCGVSAYACKAKAKKDEDMSERLDGYLFPREAELMRKVSTLQPRHLFACYNYWSQNGSDKTSPTKIPKKDRIRNQDKNKDKGKDKGKNKGPAPRSGEFEFNSKGSFGHSTYVDYEYEVEQ